jgi:hypothetical protein
MVCSVVLFQFVALSLSTGYFLSLHFRLCGVPKMYNLAIFEREEFEQPQVPVYIVSVSVSLVMQPSCPPTFSRRVVV